MAPELADPVDALEVRQHQDVEELALGKDQANKAMPTDTWWSYSPSAS